MGSELIWTGGLKAFSYAKMLPFEHRSEQATSLVSNATFWGTFRFSKILSIGFSVLPQELLKGSQKKVCQISFAAHTAQWESWHKWKRWNQTSSCSQRWSTASLLGNLHVGICCPRWDSLVQMIKRLLCVSVYYQNYMFYLYLFVHICSYLFHVQCAVCDEVRGELLGGHESGQSQSSNHSSLAASSSILERMIFCTGGQLSHHQSSVCIWCLHFGLTGMCLEEIALFDLTFALLYLARFIHKPRCFWLISGFGMIWGADNEILRLFCFFVGGVRVGFRFCLGCFRVMLSYNKGWFWE